MMRMSQQPARNRQLRQAIAVFTGVLAFPGTLLATTQEETLRSIGRSFDEAIDPTKLLAVLAALGGLLVLVVLLGMRSQRKAIPKPVNHHGKLLREVARETSLRQVELRQLRLLAEQVRNPQDEQPSPLTMMLCPSLMAEAMNKGQGKVDRAVLAELVGRMRE